MKIIINYAKKNHYSQLIQQNKKDMKKIIKTVLEAEIILIKITENFQMTTERYSISITH